MKIKEVLLLMGKVVTVQRYLSRLANQDRRIWAAYAYPTPRAGWVVGFRYLQNGDYESGSYDSFQSGSEACLSNINTVPCLEVCFWPTMRPVHVPLDGYIMGGSPMSPSAWTAPLIWSEEAKEALRKNLANVFRDGRGRFKRDALRSAET